ncbi:MAG: hypothetical protein EZS28_004874 [Streblomastix strix]|uniref:SPRY domain-containing protein n=1 Tax=Streblomastix strix TaxID=222440 RepID=A0A5J4WZ23_9EUKA|nr:MAG: hypothetical protein EZS28_004874 [Streblomastix strix]
MQSGVSSMTAVGPVDYQPFLPCKEHIKDEGEVGNIHTFTNLTEEKTTISFDPAIKNGIVKFELLNNKALLGIGIVEDTVTQYGKDEGPDAKVMNKIIQFSSLGLLIHIEAYTQNVEMFKEGDRIAMELNMDSNPRTLTFFINDKEQKVYVSNLPKAVRFWAFLYQENSSFKILSFDRIPKPTAKHSFGSKELKWEVNWLKENIKALGIDSDSDSDSYE